MSRSLPPYMENRELEISGSGSRSMILVGETRVGFVSDVLARPFAYIGSYF